MAILSKEDGKNRATRIDVLSGEDVDLPAKITL
jgi:hypothetical protein